MSDQLARRPPPAERDRVRRLIAPTARLHDAWLDARDDWGVGVHQDGSGLHPEDDVDTPPGFTVWVERLRAADDLTRTPAPGLVPATYWWVVEHPVDRPGEDPARTRMLGAISLRHELNDFLLLAGGHIGYGIRPAARRAGHATWALARVLPHARVLGLSRVLITCADTNEASARVIEHAGGELEDIRDTPLGRTRRYWVDL